MVRLKRQITASFIIACGIATVADADVWKQFRSTKDFSISYPAEWFRFGVSTDRLQVRSSSESAEGIVIERGQAMITVMEAEGSTTKTLAQVIEYYVQGASVISRRPVPNGQDKQACNRLEEVISKEAAIPSGASPINVPAIINTDIFCEVNGRKMLVFLSNWEGDDRQGQYQRIALRMAESIQIEERK